jgi:pyrroloquinoline-quinone synthase
VGQELLDRLQRRISSRSLLSHPFYQDWRQGKLTLDDLRLYAGQYYHFEATFPRFLSAVHSRCSDSDVRQSILTNLWDEESGERNHRALWLGFCAALGLAAGQVETTPAIPSTRALVDTYNDICSSRSYQEGLAVIYAYEVQVPEVASEKQAGLVQLYGLADDDALSFFQVHSYLDLEHSRLEAEAICQHTDAHKEPAVESALQEGLDAWWGFLDGVNELRSRVGAR